MRVTQAYRFCLDPTPAQRRRLASHAGAARFASNWGLAYVKACLKARAWERRILGAAVTEVPWSLAALRREWNADKDRVAPWWAENSKEAYSAGLAALADGLGAFSDSRAGRRKGRRVGFPRRKRRGRSRESFRYTTGSFGVSSRTRVQLPRIGHVRTHEPTVKLARKLEAGQARILSATVSREAGRWHCSFCCRVERSDPAPRRPAQAVGVDVGVRHLAVLSSGERVANPRALGRAGRRLRRLQRRADRQRRAANPGCFDERGRAIPGRRPATRSARLRATERRIARVYARARNLPRAALCKLSTELASTYGTVVVERLNAAGLCRAGNRGLRRAIHDASMAELRRQLAYKCAWRGGALVEAPTLFPSSKTCSGCGAAKAKLSLSERTYRCEACELVIDRDLNAARNLAALASVVAASGAETENARSQTPVRPGAAGLGVDREAGGARVARETGTAFERSEAA
ncbi:MAG: transposase [Solirubrobacterales bacterium]|nr:transposase [Solirubrobacterales bacterium]